MIRLWQKWAVMIDVNNICTHNCLYCTKHIRHLRKDQRHQMTEEEIINAIRSLEGWPGKIGLTGGEPLNYPDFERLCKIVREMIPKEKALIFTSHQEKFTRYKGLIDETFGEVYLNFHDEEQKKVCVHHPLLLSVRDMAPTETLMWQLIEECWCNKMWSPIIGKKGAFFCDCALGLDTALEMDGGWPVEPGWWKRENYRDQMEKYCPLCGMCLPYPGQRLIENTELISKGLYEKFQAHRLRNLEHLKIVDRRLTEEEIKIFAVGWQPWHNRQDRGYEGPEYINENKKTPAIKIAVVSAWYNEELLAPLFLKHYDYVDEIHIILDTATDDRTREILASDPRVIIHNQTYPPDGLDWTIKQAKVDEVYASIKADWVFAVDADEFLYKRGEKDIKAFLARQEGDIMWAKIWQVYRHETDKDIDFSQPPLLQRRHGIPLEPESVYYNLPDRAYLKPIIVRGGKNPKWNCGCHNYGGDLVECREWMEGAHWHMADPELALRRRMQTKARQGKKNLAHGLGLQNHYISEKAILYECWIHRLDPIVIFPETEDDQEKGEAAGPTKRSALEEIPEILSSKNRVSYYLSEIARIFRQYGKEGTDQALKEAFRLFPEQALYLNSMGEHLLSFEKYQDALTVFERGLIYDPTCGDLWCNLGYIAYRLGDYEKALQLTKQAIQIDGSNAIYRENLAAIEMALSNTQNGKEICLEGKEMKNSGEEPRRLIASIIIPVYNGLAYTKKCLQAIKENTPPDIYEIVVVDNGSTDGTSEYLSTVGTPVKVIKNEKNLGFTMACNQGANKAVGQYLVFLNNDTLPLKGWLSALLDTFKLSPDIGAVGGKLLYPDMRLQEAGGIVFEDGHGWNFGRGDLPEKGIYNKVIEVDYCSAAALAVRREVFFEVGGFDERYAPAYYEDTDLCFAIRQKGYRVLYQPAAEVIHFEGKTAGTDTCSGFKKYQVINREKFLVKWASQLIAQGPSPYRGAPAPFTADRRRRLAGYVHHNKTNTFEPVETEDEGISFLIIDPFLPVYDQASRSFRLFQIVKILSANPHVHITYIARDGCHGGKYIHELESMGVEVYHTDPEKLYSFGVNAAQFPPINLNYILSRRRYHYAILSFYDIALQYLPEIRLYSPQTFVLIDTVDIHFVREMREAELSGDKKKLERALNTKSNEIGIYQRADALITVTEEDARAIAPYLSDKPILVIPNIHPLEEETPTFQKRKGLIFVGNFKHPPNIDAVEFYLHEIHPLLRRKGVSMPVYIVGGGYPEELKNKWKHLHEVIFTGWVPDTKPYLAKSRISIAPLRFGAGMKGKIGEALSCGLPVVTTPIGAEGMALEHGENIFIADSADKFAELILELNKNEALWNKLSLNGKRFIEEHYSPQAVARKIYEIFKLPGEHRVKEKREAITSIVILTLNGLSYTKQCLESIFKFTLLPFELIVVDNGSKDGTGNYLQGIIEGKIPIAGHTLKVTEDGKVMGWKKDDKKAKKLDNYEPCPCRRLILIENGQNLGYAGGNNRGIAAAQGDYILISNNDVVMTKNWLNSLVEAINKLPHTGIVGPMSNYVAGPQKVAEINYDPSSLRGLDTFSSSFSLQHQGQLYKFFKVVGFCMLVKREVIEKIGGFDERFGLGNFEDDDFCLRAKLAGYDSVIAGDCFIHHFGSRTFKGEKIDYAESLYRNWEVFKRKWGIPVDLPYGTPYDVRDILGRKFSPELHYAPLRPEEYTVERAERRFEKGDIEGAIICLKRVLEREPTNTEAMNDLGYIAFTRGDLEEAIGWFERGLAVDGENADLLENLGQIYASRGDYERAIPFLEKAIKKKPDSVELINALANCLVQTGAHFRAEALYEKSYELDGDQAHVRAILDLFKKAKGLEAAERT